MAQKKGQAKPQGGKAATTMKKVKVQEAEEDPRPLRKKDLFLFEKNGKDVYYTRSVANVMFLRNPRVMKIPKGSQYIPPKGTECDGC